MKRQLNVVLCEECIYFKPKVKSDMSVGKCKSDVGDNKNVTVYAQSFCAFGVRKEDKVGKDKSRKST